MAISLQPRHLHVEFDTKTDEDDDEELLKTDATHVDVDRLELVLGR